MKKRPLMCILVMLLTMLCSVTAWADDYQPVKTSTLSQYDLNAPFGFGADITGSGDENPVTVTTLTELTNALSGTDAKTIYVDGTITFTGRVQIDGVSNKTIYGLPGATLQNPTHTATVDNTGILTLKNSSNIIIRNLTFKGAGAYDIDGNDNLTLQNCSDIWVDHCDFQDGVDGNLDANNGSDNICVSWCRFRYLITPWSGGSGDSDDHRFSNLWGGGDTATGDQGKLNTTFYACWWDDGCKQRMPRVRFGKIHILNCLYSTTAVGNYCIGAGYKSNIYVEKSAFTSSQAQSKAWKECGDTKDNVQYYNYNITLTGNEGVTDAQSRYSSSDEYFTPTYDYEYMPATSVSSEVSNHAGATLTYGAEETETTLYKWEGNSETGGTAVASNNQNADDTDIPGDINSNYIRLRGNNSFGTAIVTITFTNPLKAGDKIYVTAYRNKNETGKPSGFKAKFSNGTSTVSSSTGTEFVNINSAVSTSDEYSATPNTCTFIVPNDADGSTTMTMTRSHTSTNLFITKLEITRVTDASEEEEESSTYPITAKWDFQNLIPASIANVNIQYENEGDVASDVDGIVMHVISNGGKLAYNNTAGYAQFNTNTTIQVPVLTTSDVVTVVSYPGQSNYTVGGENASGQNTFSHTATEAEVSQGYVEIIPTATAYIYSIQVVQNEPVVEEQDFTITWSMANGATSTATASIDDVTQVSSWTTSAKIQVNSTATYGGNVITKFNPTVEHNPRVERNTDYYVEWTFKPYPGITFTPTSVSFDAVKCGTGNPSIDVDFIDGTEVTEELATDAAINRDGNDVSESNPAINHSYTMATATHSSGNAVTLRIYIGKCTTDKQVALGRVTINGKISGEKQIFTTVYNIASSLYDNDKTYEGNKGTIAPTTAEEAANAPDLEVDATSGKLGKNNDWAQILANTVLTLPGVPEGAEITFVLYDATALTINGVAYTNGQTYTATKDENVVMTCTTGGYIQSITVTGPAFVEPLAPTEGYTNTWYFGKSNGAPEFALERKPEYTYTVNDYSLVVNTDAGKLNNASRYDQWAQCNDGTTFKVPVYAGSKLTWGRYNGGSETGFTIDGQLYNEYYVATADGTVEMQAVGISYLSYIKIEPVTLYEVSGTITGGNVNGASMIFTSNGNGQPYSAVIANDAFTMSVPAGTYTPGLSDDVAYVITSPTSTTVSAAGDLDVFTIEEGTAQEVTGAITNAPAEAFTLTFTDTNNQAIQVQCEANATSYTTSLMPGTYTISSSVGELSTLSKESFKVLLSAVTFNIYYPEAASPAATQQVITVNNTITTETANNYKSVTNALAAAKAGNISAPIITLTSGQTYLEQVTVDQPDVTFTTTGSEKATITFYYGIGYSYYSLAANGYYDRDRAMTRNSILTVNPARWGATVRVTRDGDRFKAENIIFENSFNQRYTAEEIADGVTPKHVGDATINYNRQLGPNDSGYKAADSKDVTERAAAIAFENAPEDCELYDCEFHGSQDTFYTSGQLYVKNCSIEGNTDYIFGGGYVVFDNCDLVIGGYSDKETSAYITAYKDGSTVSESERYIFRDCTVKSGGRNYVLANLGRDWGGAAASVYYFNLKNDIGNKLSYTWNNMGGGVAAGEANLHIYDFDPTVNANYSSTGPTGANINGVLDDAIALDIYAGVVNKLGFPPKHIYDGNVVLDEASYYNVCRIAATDNVERTVELTRSIGADKWNTIVLPFDLTEAQVKAAFGDGVKVAALNDKTTADNLSFSTATQMVANQPYAIKVANAVSSATFNGVTVKHAEEPVQTISGWDFVGTYTKGNVPKDSYFFSSNQLWQAKDATNTIKAFRGWFTYNGSNPARQLTFSVDSETTGIQLNDNVNKNENVNYYDLQGRRVAQPKKGLYIKDNKKVIIK